MGAVKPPRDEQRILADEVPVMARAFTGTQPGNVRSAVIPIYQPMDTELAAAPMPIACTVGCSWCCHYRVVVTAVEAMAIAEHVTALPPD